MVRRQLHPNWTAIYDDQEAESEKERAMRQALFVGHGEDAIPAGRRLIEEIFLAALPIGAGWAVVGPPIENGLERFLGVHGGPGLRGHPALDRLWTPNVVAFAANARLGSHCRRRGSALLSVAGLDALAGC